MPNLSPTCAAALADPGYQQALKSAGYTGNETFEYAGKTVTHQDVAMAFEQSYARHHDEFMPRMGAKDRYNRKLRRKYESTVKEDVRTQFGISGWTIGFAIVLGILGGPAGLLLAIITCLFEYYFNKDLDGAQEIKQMLLGYAVRA